jgi:hypothetical protein
MDNIKIVEIEGISGIQSYVIIDRGNGEFTSMLKAVYEAQQVEHLTEIPTPPAE